MRVSSQCLVKLLLTLYVQAVIDGVFDEEAFRLTDCCHIVCCSCLQDATLCPKCGADELKTMPLTLNVSSLSAGFALERAEQVLPATSSHHSSLPPSEGDSVRPHGCF